MSPMIMIILTALAVLFVLLLILFIRRRQDSLFMAQNQHFASGTVVDVRSIHTQNNVNDRVKITYTVNEKEYTHICFSRPGKFRRDQTVQIIYHPDKPKLAFPESLFRVMPESDVRMMIIFFVLLYVFTVCFTLSYVSDSFGRFFDHFEIPLMLSSAWFFYWTEHRIFRSGKRCTGTIVYAERDRKTVRVVAEFAVNGVNYDTRMMNLPVKKCRREYHQGGQIGVMYREENPVESAIEDDNGKEKATKTYAIICSIILPVFWVLMVFI